MPTTRKNQHLIIGADAPLLQSFHRALMAMGKDVVFANIETGALSMNDIYKSCFTGIPELKNALHEQKTEFSSVWLFNPGANNRNSGIIHEALTSLLEWRLPAVHYIYGPGSNSLPERYVDASPHTALYFIQLPHFIIDPVSGTIFSSGLAEQLMYIKEEAELKMPLFWEHNAFPLAGGCYREPMTAAYLQDLFHIPAPGEAAYQRGQVIFFRTAEPFTLYDLCKGVLGVGVEPLDGEGDNPLAKLIHEVAGSFLYGEFPGFTGERCPLDTGVTGNEIITLLVKQFHSGSKTLPTEQGDAFSRMEERTITAKDDRSIRYLVGGAGTDTIMIINALGLTIRFWDRCLQLLQRSYRVIVWETRCCNLFDGGMEQVVTIDEHVDDIVEIIRAEQGHSCHLISWCNGGRIAVAAAARERMLIASLVLLCPVFRGIEGLPGDDTRFEKELDEVFREVSKNSRVAGLFAEYLVRSNNKREEPATGAHYILSLPDEPFRKEVIAPMRTGNYLINYALRTFNDERYPVRSLIGEVSQPAMIILGSDDAVISNHLTASASALFKNAQVFMVAGASHYIQLQHPHIFAALIGNFIKKKEYEEPGIRVRKINVNN
ncbi:MAG TPA: alpha/beta hydrolase [Puia sp.]|nr:alpha/beta hydrolase [Puia sp.]